ncbi:hypothetical protein Golomagni_06895 [Golovinomyces magnicellulatus]|nr:hypothetical protein Golomagni_06895 [Golovinomyces magnicellulatus]
MTVLGGFCGYRNVQMLFSYVIGISDLGTEWYGKAIPSIFEIQDYIEEAWNKGYNSKGRAETGGIKDTRKYIGTPEVQATFASLEIPSSVQRFQSCEQSSAAVQLLAAIQAYFQQDTLALGSSKLRLTTLPPIYLQQPGHSMTIVGMQTLEDGQSKLLVFDPTYQDSDAMITMQQRSQTRIRSSSAAQLLSAYCRDATYLEKYSEFELF